MKLKQRFITTFNAYCTLVGVAESTLSTRLLGGGRRFAAIKDGGDLTTSTYEAAMLYFSAYWPENADWPDEIERPKILTEA